MQVGDVMSSEIICISADATVFDAAEILVGAGISAAPVVDAKGIVVGIVSEADLMRRSEIGTQPHKSFLARMLANDSRSAAEYVAYHSRHVSDVMSREVITVEEETSLPTAADLMVEHKVKRLPVMRGKEVVGIVSRANLLQALLSREPYAQATKRTDDEIRQEVGSVIEKQPWTSPWPTNVLVSNGVVHLWGFVQNETVSKAYRIAAENVAGVRKVKCHLRRLPASVGMGH